MNIYTIYAYNKYQFYFIPIFSILYQGWPRNSERTDNIFQSVFLPSQGTFPAGIYLLKVNNRNTRTRCEICSKLTIKTPERR